MKVEQRLAASPGLVQLVLPGAVAGVPSGGAGNGDALGEFPIVPKLLAGNDEVQAATGGPTAYVGLRPIDRATEPTPSFWFAPWSICTTAPADRR